MADQGSMHNIVVWGVPNEQKTSSPTKWDHDYLLNASVKGGLDVIENPETLLPYILDVDAGSVEGKELYDGVFEYKAGHVTVEMVEGFEYSEYKIYGKGIDFDAMLQRLKAAGATVQKPPMPIEIPGRPPELDENEINARRYLYKPEILTKDISIAKEETAKSTVRNFFTFLFVGTIAVFFGYELLVPKLKPVDVLPSDFVTAHDSYIVYSLENRMVVFKIADKVENFDAYDSTYTLWLGETAEIGKNNVLEQIQSPDGDVIYKRENRIVDFESDPKEYGYVNTNPFVFDGYGKGNEQDWEQYGELEKGNAQKIVVKGRITIEEGKYIILLGRTRGVLGEASPEVEPFYELMEDEVSRAAVLYSLKFTKGITLYGQIQKTLGSREGRNSVQRMIFTLKAEYAR